jgi:hypothetical protein
LRERKLLPHSALVKEEEEEEAPLDRRYVGIDFIVDVR